MTPAEFEAFSSASAVAFAADLVRAGLVDEASALGEARSRRDEVLPNGLDTPDHFFRAVLNERTGARVGEVWYAFLPGGQAFVYWIGIDAAQRGRGYGTATLRWLEEEARRNGQRSIGLHVFGHNPRAHALYQRLGFRPTDIRMAKDLPG
jgi:ribosomal protein S18 acetylase RimI-like enzyme